MSSLHQPADKDDFGESRTIYVHLVNDNAGGMHGVTTDEFHVVPGATVSVRPAKSESDGRPCWLMIVTLPRDSGGLAK